MDPSEPVIPNSDIQFESTKFAQEQLMPQLIELKRLWWTKWNTYDGRSDEAKKQAKWALYGKVKVIVEYWATMILISQGREVNELSLGNFWSWEAIMDNGEAD